MQEPIWVLDEVVLAIHRRQLAEHGGLDGVRDAGLLDSALNKPKNTYYYGGAGIDIMALAAAYAYGIARNHPFMDGNKRTVFVVCCLFLRLNGYTVQASQEEKYAVFYRLAAGEVTEEQLGDWLRKVGAKA